MKSTYMLTRASLALLLLLALLSSPAKGVLAQGPLTITPDAAQKSGQAGSVVFYTLSVQNSGSTDLSLTVETHGLNNWPVTSDPPAFVLAAGGSQNVVIAVAIPITAPDGATEVTSVYLKDATSNALLGSIALTTRASVPPSPTVPASGRPLVVLESYSIEEGGPIAPGQEFGLRLRMANTGQGAARDILFTFTSENFLPRDTGGVRTLRSLASDERKDVVQRFLASPTLSGSVATLTVNVTYSDPAGTAYTATFTITIDLKQPVYSGGPARPTATSTPISRPQLVITGYHSDVDPLQPGSVFNLDLEIRNLGNSHARNVTMMLGGGVLTGDNSGGTAQPGGYSASGSDLSVFAPLGSSNVLYLGDVPLGQAIRAGAQLIVNVSANPGAYSFKVSFVYDDEKGNRQVNDQVITLLVYSLPQVDISFYRDPGFFQAGMPTVLPLQITNLGRKSAVLGTMRVSAENADLSNNTALVGPLEPGGYFTLDVNFTPFQPGPQTITVTVNYTDDFNQPRTLEQALPIDVAEAPAMETPALPGGEGGLPAEPPTGPETFWQALWRFIKGLLGLGSGRSQPTPASPEMPPETPPQPVPLPGGKG